MPRSAASGIEKKKTKKKKKKEKTRKKEKKRVNTAGMRLLSLNVCLQKLGLDWKLGFPSFPELVRVTHCS